MLLNLCGTTQGIFQNKYRTQFLAAISVTIITFGHGIVLGWLSPMLMKLQSAEQTPLDFAIDLEQASWVGALICMGGLCGNAIFGFILDRFGRKPCLYGLAVPQLCVWFLIYFARSVEYLYVSRVFAGTTGGGCYVVLPIFIGEISDSKIRGRLTSLFPLTLNTGILSGYILGAHLEYFSIPFIGISLPILYLILVSRLLETPQFLLRNGKEEKALQSFRFYKNCTKEIPKSEVQQFENEFNEIKSAAHALHPTQSGEITWDDIFNKSTFCAICSSLVLMLINAFSGTYALISYMSSAFADAKVELNPDTNTIIIGVVQIIGTFAAIFVVDRYGRRILMIISCAGMGSGLFFFGLYGFFAQETNYDLSNYSRWLPLLLMAFTIFSANIGVIPVTFVLLVELLPAKIRSRAVSFCLAFLSVFGFISVKTFPICLYVLGLATTMWICTGFCAFGLFYLPIFVKETNGMSLNKE